MPPTPADDEGPDLAELYPHRISPDPLPTDDPTGLRALALSRLAATERAEVLGGYGLAAARAQQPVEGEVLDAEYVPPRPAACPWKPDRGCVTCAEQQVEPCPVEPEVVEGEVLDAADPLDAHAVKSDDRGAIVHLSCRCGQWEAAAGGPSSLRWAARSHRQHVREVLGG